MQGPPSLIPLATAVPGSADVMQQGTSLALLLCDMQLFSATTVLGQNHGSAFGGMGGDLGLGDSTATWLIGVPVSTTDVALKPWVSHTVRHGKLNLTRPQRIQTSNAGWPEEYVLSLGFPLYLSFLLLFLFLLPPTPTLSFSLLSPSLLPYSFPIP